MRVKIELINIKKQTCLPAAFQSILQAVIYENLSQVSADWLHNEGFKFEKRSFKFFTFSSILEKGIFDNKEKKFTFGSEISFLVASPVDWILQQFASNLMKQGSVRLAANIMAVNSISVFKTNSISENSMIIKAVTPMEMHSTFTTTEGKKKTHYYTPFESDFSRLINSNLQKKWMALFGKDFCPYNIKITPLFKGNRNERIMYFGTGPLKTLVKGWKGKYRLEGQPAFLQIAMDAGLGGKNAQGFGMIDFYAYPPKTGHAC